MASQVILKKSSVAARVPVVGDLVYGELALNYADGLLYYKKSDGTTIGSFGAGTVTSVGGTGTVSGLTLSGTVTSSGSLTLGGTLAVTATNFASQTANTVLAAPNNAAGVPTFRNLTLEDLSGAWVKKSVRAATTANITLSAPQTIDGIVLVAGDRVLVKNQTTTATNGIYVVAAAAWARTLDADTADEIAGAFVNVDAGTVNGGKVFDNDFKSTDTLNTTAMVWSQNVDAGYFTTVGNSFATLTNVAAIAFPRINADNTISSLDAATFRTAIGAGTSSTTGTVTSVAAITLGTTGTDISSTVATGTTTPVITLNIPTASATNRGALSATDWATFNGKITLSSPITGYVANTNTALVATDTLVAALGKIQGQITARSGTVTSVGGTGTVSGLTLSGTVTSSGSLTLGGTLAVLPSNFASQTANTVLAAPDSAAGAPTFRNLTLTDLPDAWVKKAVGAATTAALTINTAQTTIDGVTLAASTRVLIKNQAAPAQNGIYTGVTTTTWVRTPDTNTASEIAGAFVNVDAGTVNGGKVFDNDFKSTDVLGTAAMNWSQNVDAGYFTTVGNSFATLANPTAITFPRINADNTVSALTAALFRTAIGAGTSSTTGTVTGVTATAPVASSGGTAPVISMAAATTTVNGYLTSTDWTTFNGKIGNGTGSFAPGAVAEVGRYFDFHGGTGAATDYDVRLDCGPGTGTLGAGTLTVTASGGLVCTGNVTAFSDLRLKTDLEVIPNALAKVKQLTGYTYTRVDSNQRQTGLIAQDVQKVLPEAVAEGEYLSLAYGNLVGLLVEAIKEQQTTIDSQESRIARLEVLVSKLLKV